MATTNTWTINDYSNEKSTFGLTSVSIDEANIDDQQTLAATLTGAIDNLTIGELVKQVQQLVILDDPAIPTSPYAQREMKWLVSYVGNVSGKVFQTEIAAPDITDNVVTNSDTANLASTDWAAFKTAFEAYVRSPDDEEEEVTLVAARLVGRNI